MARTFALVLAALALVVVAGCGGEEDAAPLPETVEGEVPTGAEQPEVEGDAEAGAGIFAAQGCGSCHVLADAGATGAVGPNLDTSSIDVAAAAAQIRSGGGGMPAYEGQLSDEEIANVAAYVVQARSG